MGVVQGDVCFGFADFRGKLALHVAQLAAGIMREVHCFQHFGFGDFRRACFHHRNGVIGGRDNQIKRAFLLLRE